ncbi:MAG: phenylalanine--tRNA ligase subunit beta, partial [Planctomycetota bacterium]
VGAPLADALDLRDDVFEIDNKSITHRPDLWGHYGFARELAAIYGRPLAPPPAPARPAPGEPFPVEIADAELCPLYLALPFEGASNAPSPLWLRRLLLAVGQRPLGAVVDLTNFVMLDLGEPTHAFDRRRLRGGRIVVRRAREGERMKTLDGVERLLAREDLLIADAEGPVAVAGVMGGEASEVRADTTAFVLECAAFHPVSVRRTAQRLGLRTEASARFEKSLDPTLVDWAAARFAELLPQVCPGARVTGPATRAGNWRFSPRTIPLRTDRTRARLGVALPTEKMAEFLRRLQFSVEPAGPDLRVGVPSFRATKDVTIEDDLVEEVGRMLRYGNIPPSVPSFPAKPPPPDEERALARTAADALAGPLGFREAYGYT